MSQRTAATDPWARAARLLAAVLLVGGMVAGPAAHAASSTWSGHEHGQPAAPDGPQDCPVCITLSGGVAPAPASAPTLFDSHSERPAAAPAARHVRSAPDRDRARAPPIA